MKRYSVDLSLVRLLVLAILIALDVVVSRFLSFGTTVWQVSLGFIVGVVMAEVAGPVWTGLGFGVADIVGATLLSKYGYNWQFTLSAVIVGVIYGLFFYGKRLDWSRVRDWFYVLLAVVVIMLIDSVFFNSLWVAMLSKLNFEVAVVTRLPLLLQIPLRLVIIMLVVPALQRIPQVMKLMQNKA